MPQIDNITQFEPEIPEAASAPKQVKDVSMTPFTAPPIVTSRKAREVTQKNLKRLSEITGINYEL